MDMRKTALLALLALILFSYKNGEVKAQKLTSVWIDDIADALDVGMESAGTQMCDISLGECDEEDSDVRGRLLRRLRYYISYGALAANRVPCPPRSGRSYYTRNCYSARGQVHPYRRGCTAITRCRRYTS